MNTNNGWLDIASAPKDGTGILGYWDVGGIHDCNFRAVKFHRGAWWETNEDYKVRQPTHWMPLPAAPGSPAETLAYTVTVDPDPRGVSVGVYLGSSCVYHGAHAIPAGAVADEGAKDWRQEVETDSFDDPSALSAVADALAGDTSNDNAQFAAAYLYRQARALIEAPAAGDARALAFVQEVAQQKPEKPDHWSSCGQCASNISQASDLLDAISASQQGGE